MYQLPTIEEFKSQSAQQQKLVYDHLFEPCDSVTWFIDTYVIKENFKTYPEFIELVRTRLLQTLNQTTFFKSRNSKECNTLIENIISAHPRLGAPKGTKLSEHSTNEQKKLEGIQSRLKELNEQYESTFPGLRYVVFVNGRSRDEIIKNMEDRIARNNIELEKIDALEAMCDIALDRASKLGVKL
ncbi:uncharacterized protein KGF55_005317 [Candida pseudojiufengensis]|uniref:uncharacterized protein n=1 Tax=Candida pseudojiufengensis TaxID=497109 RepID=UPI0022243D10|nr:uncharacterized protein KGF55_005317 [Candida pseudojiufengensis]KAI5959489.1 hypothetical protein KGF55_005317 [Candida pseudojiufengensis]